MKEISQGRRVLALTLLLLMALNMGMSLAVNAVSAGKGAARREWDNWSGTQKPGSITVHKIRIVGNCIEIHGKIRMDVIPGGYEFGDIKVDYELIRYLEIHVPPQFGELLNTIRELLRQGMDPNDFLLDPNVIAMFYSFPRSGWFTWHTEDGEVVGRGTFESNGQLGQLCATGHISVFVAGTFWINGLTEEGLPTIAHQGQYIVR